MSLDAPLVIVGGGQAAAQLCESARRLGHRGPLTLVSDEALLPYCRPPLSKQYLVGQHPPDWLLYRPASFYERHGIETRLGRRVVSIERERHEVQLDDGSRLPYAGLGLALGARVRRLGVPGDQHVCYLRGFDDVQRLRVSLLKARSVVVIGGGFIGLETAAVLVQTGRRVTLLASEATVLPRVGAPLAAFLQRRHTAAGVQLVTSCRVTEVRAREGGAGLDVLTRDGRVHSGDVVIAGIGIVPNTELAQAAGLACDDGIVVDECGRTSDPHITAAGDCTRHPNRLSTRALRLETVHNAVEQARSAAAALCGRDDLPYRQTPWVWSDQYDLRLQSVGVFEDIDQTVQRGRPESGAFSLLHFRAGRFVALEGVNRPGDFGAARLLLNLGQGPTPAQASDTTFDLRGLLPPKRPLLFETPWPPKAIHRFGAIA